MPFLSVVEPVLPAHADVDALAEGSFAAPFERSEPPLTVILGTPLRAGARVTDVTSL